MSKLEREVGQQLLAKNGRGRCGSPTPAGCSPSTRAGSCPRWSWPRLIWRLNAARWSAS
ncbi:hypothetical protein ACRAWF_36145 [Streptomyces sp. L7]